MLVVGMQVEGLFGSRVLGAAVSISKTASHAPDTAVDLVKIVATSAVVELKRP
jgi:hypothetical protein